MPAAATAAPAMALPMPLPASPALSRACSVFFASSCTSSSALTASPLSPLIRIMTLLIVPPSVILHPSPGVPLPARPRDACAPSLRPLPCRSARLRTLPVPTTMCERPTHPAARCLAVSCGLVRACPKSMGRQSGRHNSAQGTRQSDRVRASAFGNRAAPLLHRGTHSTGCPCASGFATHSEFFCRLRRHLPSSQHLLA